MRIMDELTSDEKEKIRKEEVRKKVQKILANPSKSLDEPRIYENIKTQGWGHWMIMFGGGGQEGTETVRESEYITTLRMKKMEAYLPNTKLKKKIIYPNTVISRTTNRIIGSYPTTVIESFRTTPLSPFEKKQFEVLKRKIDFIKKSNDPIMYEEGVIKFINGFLPDQISTTYRCALLSLGEEGLEQFFEAKNPEVQKQIEDRKKARSRKELERRQEEARIRREEVEKKRAEQEQQKRAEEEQRMLEDAQRQAEEAIMKKNQTRQEEQQATRGITLSGIKQAILKVLEKGERL